MKDPLFHTVGGTCQLLGCGRTKLYQLIKQGHLKTAKLGSKTLISTESIMRFAAELVAKEAAQ